MRVDPSKAWLVASREYLENVRTRGFWVSLLLMPVLLLVMAIAPVLLADVESVARYAVYDQSGWVQRAVAAQIAQVDAAFLLEALENLDVDERPAAVAELPPLPTPESRSQLASAIAERFIQLQSQGPSVHAPTTPDERPAKPEDRPAEPEVRIARWWHDDPEAAVRIAPDLSTARYQYVATPALSRADLNQQLADDSLLGYFVIPDDPVVDGRDAMYVTRKLTNLEVRNWYAGLVTNIVRDRRIREENIPSSTADWIQTPLTFDTTRLTDSGTETAAQLGDTLTQWAPVAFVYLLWISIFSVTQMLLTNTVEEKSNKLVEVLLSSLRPVDLMAGKIVGIAATGLTIVGSWLVIFLAVVLWLPGLLGAPVSFDLTALVDRPIYLVSFFVYFLLGYLFYAALLCGLGSMANNLKEAQTLMMPVQLLLIVPLIVMVPIGRDPHGLLAQILSWIPPFTPFVMMNRAAFPPSEFTYVGTTLLMLVSIYFALTLASRVFERGVLMTGQPPKLRQLFRLLRGDRARARR